MLKAPNPLNPHGGTQIKDVKSRVGHVDYNGNLYENPVQPRNIGQRPGSGMAGAGNCIDCGIPVPANEGCNDPGSRTIESPTGPTAKGTRALNSRDYPAR